MNDRQKEGSVSSKGPVNTIFKEEIMKTSPRVNYDFVIPYFLACLDFHLKTSIKPEIRPS